MSQPQENGAVPRQKSLKPPTPSSSFRNIAQKRLASGASLKENAAPERLGAKRLKVGASTLAKKPPGLTRSASTLLHPSTGGAAKASSSQTSLRSAASAVSLAVSAPNKRKPWDLKGRVADLEEMLKTISGDKKQLAIAHHETSEQAEGMRKTIAELRARAEGKEALEVENSNLKALLETAKQEAAVALTRVAALQLEKSSLEATIVDLTSSTAGLRTQNSALSSLYETAQDQIQSLKAAQEELESKVARIEAELEQSEETRRALHNDLQELKGNIRVFCRMRPLLDSEKCAGCEPATITFPDERSVEVVKVDPQTSRPKTHTFSFDKVFPSGSQQADVYKEVSHLVQSALDGYNVCIFAYGQTGSGKTFTMQGPEAVRLCAEDKDLVGLIPRALRQIFDVSQKLQGQHWVYTLTASFLEVYNEEIKDLLVDKPNKKCPTSCQLKTSKSDGSVIISNITEVQVMSADEIYELLNRAQKNRSTGATQSNEHSSRSHSVCRLRITGSNTRSGQGCKGTLNLVDLAGSERLSKSKAEGVRLAETKNINKSLSNLSNVILALSRKDDHIPYRNSKLTHLLMNSLGGNSKTLMMLNISPTEDHLGETLTSLRFAAKVNDCSIGTAQQNVQI